MRKFKSICVVLSAMAAGIAHAKAPDLPASAVRLKGPDIVKLYHGNAASYDNFTQKVPLTGTVYFDFDKKRVWGFFLSDNKDRGLFKGTIGVSGDDFCYKMEKAKKFCNAVHRDGDKIYEVGKKGIVTSLNTVHSAAPPAVPADARKATPDDVQKLFGGKFVNVTIYDLDAPTIARLKWEWKKKRVTGDYIHDGKNSGKVNNVISVDGDKVCTKGKGDKQANCYAVVIKDNTFYEITGEGKVHAVSVAD